MRAVSKILFTLVAATACGVAQNPVPGRAQFENRCSVCHGADGTGGELGPAIVRRVTRLSDQEITTTVRNGLPARGMPASNVTDAEMGQLLIFLRTLKPDRRAAVLRHA